MFSFIKKFIPTSFGSILGVLKPIGVIIGGYAFLQQIRKWSNPLFQDLALANPFIKILFLIFVATFFGAIFYSRIAKTLGFKKTDWMHGWVLKSVPITLLCLLGYFAYVNYLKHEDKSYDYLKSATTRDEVIIALDKSKVNHSDKAKANPDHLHQLIKAQYSEAVYDEIFKKVNSGYLTRLRYADDRFPLGYTPLLYAIYQNNEAAVRSLAKLVDLRVEFTYTPPQTNTWTSYIYWSTNPVTKATYNACKIAIYEQKTNLVKAINEVGAKRWTGWNVEKDGKLGPEDFQI